MSQKRLMPAAYAAPNGSLCLTAGDHQLVSSPLVSALSLLSLSHWLWEHSDGHSQDSCLRVLGIAVNPDSEDQPAQESVCHRGRQPGGCGCPWVPPIGHRFHQKLHISRARPPKHRVASGPSEQLPLTELPPVSQALVPLGLSLGQVPLHKVCSMGSGQHWPGPPARRPH